MDILDTIRRQVDTLPKGPHSTGLRAVLRHVEVGFRHLERGQREGDDTAFTDALYRTNQAFEGSIKEAYRVLAGKDPANQKLYDIEQYLEANQVFRPRVLQQFTSYRQNWRNPATHEYALDFDEDEAFVAIVSVSAFAKVLINQIAEKLAFKVVAEDVRVHSVQAGISPGETLLDHVRDGILQFANEYVPTNPALSLADEAQLVGALAGFLQTICPGMTFLTEADVGTREHGGRVDLLATRDDEKLVVEVKRRADKRARNDAIDQLARYMEAAASRFGILFLYGGQGRRYSSLPGRNAVGDTRIILPGEPAAAQAQPRGVSR